MFIERQLIRIKGNALGKCIALESKPRPQLIVWTVDSEQWTVDSEQYAPIFLR